MRFLQPFPFSHRLSNYLRFIQKGELFVAVYEGMRVAYVTLTHIRAPRCVGATSGRGDGDGRGQTERSNGRGRRRATMSRGYNDDLRTGYPGFLVDFAVTNCS